MTDREVFRHNLNYFLKEKDCQQKDLAEYVGATAATVSGWTRGVSYPRADAMEKIANFFGIPTSRLIGSISVDLPTDKEMEDQPIRIVSTTMEDLSAEEKEYIKSVVLAIVQQMKKKEDKKQ